MEEYEEKNREEAIIYYQKRDEVEQAWREHEENSSREPAKIVVEMPITEENEIQNHSFPF
jgi:hypothetical protein